MVLLCTLPSCTKEARAGRKLDAAREHMKESDLAAAEIEFKNVLELEPGQPQALKGLGLIWARQGVLLEAARILTSAQVGLPTDDEVALARARALFGLGFIDDSRTQLEEMLERNPANGEALMLYAETSSTPDTLTQCEERIARVGASVDKWIQLASALLELRRGMIESGTSGVERILAKDPDFPHALALRATIFRVRKPLEKALEPLVKAAGLAGPRSEESVAYGMLLMELERADDATAWFKAATEKAPDYVPSWFNLARIAFAGGNDAEASVHLEKVFRLAPLDIPSSLLQSQILMRAQEPDKAMELLAKLGTAFPERPNINLALAKACMAANKLDKAATALESAIAKVPGAPELLILRARIHLSQNEAADAALLLEPILEKSPANREVRDLLVSTYDALGRTAESTALLEAGLEGSGGEDMKASFRLGQHLLAQGKFAEARAAFDTVRKSDPESLEVIAHLIAVDLKEEKPADAMARVDAYLTAHPESNDAMRLKAELFDRSGDLKAAEATAQKALEIKPDDLLAYGIVVNVLIREKRSDEAVEQLRKLIAAAPDNERAKLHLGLILMQMGRSDEARAAFGEVLKTSPDSASALNNLAYLESADPASLKSARDHAAKARQISPKDFAVADTLGWIEWQLGNRAGALPLLTEAASALPNMPSVQYHLGVARSAMGQVDEAQAAFTKALASGVEFPEKEDARNRLETLGKAGDASIADLEKRIAANPQDVPGQLALAGRYAESGRTDDALASYEAALKVNPSLPAAYIGIARLYSGPLKSAEKALAAATKARSLAPRDPQALAVLGTAKLRAGLPQEAYGLFKDASGEIGDNPAFQADFAEAAYLLGRTGEAREVIAPVAASESPESAAAKRFLLLTSPDAGEHPDAAAEVEKALAENPADVAALMVRGQLETIAGKDAVTTYREILKIQPGFDAARVRLAGVLLQDSTKLDEALSLARQARGKLPADADLAGILGIASYRKGDSRYAAQVLKELATQRTLAAGEFFALGMSQAAIGDKSGSVANLTSAIGAGLDDAQAAEAKAALAKAEAPESSE